jgi:ribonucleotide monophosphatase NagD (HAD superfamily)
MIREAGQWATKEVRFLTNDPRPTREQLRRQASRHMFAGARFVATNADTSFPSPKGPLPGTGAIVEALRVTTSVEPMIVGKPSADAIGGKL